jgi:Zn-dependent M28 family amino/carboxypeptidase
LIFLAVTGEENGLLGSEFYAEYPTFPMDDIVANLNLDMYLMLHPLHDIIAFGAEHSSLEETVSKAASEFGVRLSPDPYPNEVIFVRSDQFSFVRKGVPAVFLVEGWDSGDPGLDGAAMNRRWMRDIYHTQRDDMGQEIDFEAGVLFARINFLIGWRVGNETAPPTWNPGDFFGERFGKER